MILVILETRKTDFEKINLKKLKLKKKYWDSLAPDEKKSILQNYCENFFNKTAEVINWSEVVL